MRKSINKTYLEDGESSVADEIHSVLSSEEAEVDDIEEHVDERDEANEAYDQFCDGKRSAITKR